MGVVAAVRAVFLILELAVLAEVIWSWVQPSPYDMHPVRLWLRRLTEPILEPIRRVIPPLGGTLDISPIVALLLLRLLERLVVGVLDPYGTGF